jgi:hypothetical protein
MRYLLCDLVHFVVNIPFGYYDSPIRVHLRPSAVPLLFPFGFFLGCAHERALRFGCRV